MSKKAEEEALKALPNYSPETYADEDEYIEVESVRSVQRAFYRQGYEQAEKDLGWHPSTEHPPVDEEVIVLTDIITKGGLNVGLGKIAFGHIVDKDIAVDYDGWNIEDVRYWMLMPKIPEK